MQKNEEIVGSCAVHSSGNFSEGPRARGAGLGDVCLSAAGVCWGRRNGHRE